MSIHTHTCTHIYTPYTCIYIHMVSLSLSLSLCLCSATQEVSEVDWIWGLRNRKRIQNNIHPDFLLSPLKSPRVEQGRPAYGSLWAYVLGFWFLVSGSHFHLTCSLMYSISPQTPEMDTIFLPEGSLSITTGHLLDEVQQHRGGAWATQWKRPRCHLQITLLSPQSPSWWDLLPIQRTVSFFPSSGTGLTIPDYASFKPEQPDPEL